MLRIFSPQEEGCQVAVLNPEGKKENIKIPAMNAKRAQILKKDKYKVGVPANTNERITLDWEVKNLTNVAWSDDVIIVCHDNSDLKINDQRANLKLNPSEKGEIKIEFIMPSDTRGLKELNMSFFLLDRECNKAMGEELKVKLIVYK